MKTTNNKRGGEYKLSDNKKVYDPKERIKYIFNKIWEHGSKAVAAKNIVSTHTGRSVTAQALDNYVRAHGYRIVMGPYLIDKDNNVIDANTL